MLYAKLLTDSLSINAITYRFFDTFLSSVVPKEINKQNKRTGHSRDWSLLLFGSVYHCC